MGFSHYVDYPQCIIPDIQFDYPARNFAGLLFSIFQSSIIVYVLILKG